MMNDLMIQETRRSSNAPAQDIYETGRPTLRFEDLPLDVQYNIVAKLPPKEFARTSVLSSKRRFMWPELCPRLTFNGVEVCKCSSDDLYQFIDKFIHEVNAILHKHHAKVVETLEIKINLNDYKLVYHLNNWVAFAASSRTKNLTLDLKPEWYLRDRDRYVFPFQLLNSGSISRLQNMQLSFVSLKPPSKFKGFPNLKALHLQLVQISHKDLQDMLPHCYSLQRLHIDRCNLNNDELVVDGLLPHLLYLRVVEYKNRLSRIEFRAANLATFEYTGPFVPINLRHSLNLQNANIGFEQAVLHHALMSLLNGLPHTQNLTLQVHWVHLEKQGLLWDNPLQFSYLRHLQLSMFVDSKDGDKVLYSVLFLRAAPFIEKLEVHFSSALWLVDKGPRRQDLVQCKCKNLKNMHITEFQATRAQIEFVLHVVKNAPALEVVTVKTSKTFASCGPRKPAPFEEVKQIASSLCTALPKNVKFHVI